MKLIGCSGGYHPEDMDQHKQYIAHDMKQRRALPEDYPTLLSLSEVVRPVKPATDGEEQQLHLLSPDLAKSAGKIVKAALAAPSRKGAAKSVLAKDGPAGVQKAHKNKQHSRATRKGERGKQCVLGPNKCTAQVSSPSADPNNSEWQHSATPLQRVPKKFPVHAALSRIT